MLSESQWPPSGNTFATKSRPCRDFTVFPFGIALGFLYICIGKHWEMGKRHGPVVTMLPFCGHCESDNIQICQDYLRSEICTNPPSVLWELSTCGKKPPCGATSGNLCNEWHPFTSLFISIDTFGQYSEHQIGHSDKLCCPNVDRFFFESKKT